MADVLGYIALGWMTIGLAVQLPVFLTTMLWFLKEDVSSADLETQDRVRRLRAASKGKCKVTSMINSLVDLMVMLAIYIFVAAIWPKEFINK